MSMRVTVLGCGGSGGVPLLGNEWGACNPANPRNRRRRVSVLVETGGQGILLDASPDLRAQLLDAGVATLDAVLFTHDHADHTHGLDDIRALSMLRDAPLPLYGSRETLESLTRKFSYIFDDNVRPLPGTSKPEAQLNVVEPGQSLRVADLDVVVATVPHGHAEVLAYRFGPLAYITDAKSVPAETIEVMRGARVLVLNALLRTSHPTHLSISEAIEVAREIGAERTYFTHLTHETSHADLEAELPAGISPAFDGLTIRIEED